MEDPPKNISGGCENYEERCGVVGETIVKGGQKSTVFWFSVGILSGNNER
jgi:hypothetical protein